MDRMGIEYRFVHLYLKRVIRFASCCVQKFNNTLAATLDQYFTTENLPYEFEIRNTFTSLTISP